MIDALEIAQSIIYAKQSALKYRDKEGRQLAWVLSEYPVRRKEPPMLLDMRKIATKVEEKIVIFS